MFHTAKRNLKKAFHVLLHRISHYANESITRLEFLKQTSQLLIDFSGCDEMELWLLDFGRQKRCEVIRRSRDSFRYEIQDFTDDKKLDRQSSGMNGNSAMHRLCRNVLDDSIDASSKTFIERDSLPRAAIRESACGEKKTVTETGESGDGIIIPLMSGDKIIGLLQFLDRRKKYFARAESVLYEDFAQTLGISLYNQRAQAALRERVKELTCMYGIAQAAGAGASIDEIMQGAAERLPPAWQYPRIAQGRIVLDGRVYESPGYVNGPYRLSAAIMVNNETRGNVEVVYTEETFTLDEGPFLMEERNLIDNIANALALVVERKQAEDEKARLRDQIRHADRLATIGQLAAGVAHELNEPLGAILGYAQLMEKDLPAAAHMRQDAGRIVKASLHAREIVRKLLIFARQMPIKKTKIGINQIVAESLSFLESLYSQAGVTVVSELADNLPDITADPSQITQVIVNLVVNSVQAMTKGGSITARTFSSDGQVFLVIEDTGEGMSDETMKRIFLPFFTTKEVGQGTGLGLAVVHGIVSSHGGSIAVASAEGAGSRFEIRFPCAEHVERHEH